MNRRVAVVLLAACVVGCSAWFNRVDYFHMAPRLEYERFSFNRPPNPNWYLLQSEGSRTHVILRRELRDHPSPTHTFYASVALASIDREPKSPEDFAELVRAEKQEAPYEVRTVSYKQRLVTRQGQWCIRYEGSYAVLGAPVAPGRKLTMIVRGYRCLHPAWPKTVLSFYYSERGLPDEIDPKLWKEGETFLDGVRIDVAPGTPAS